MPLCRMLTVSGIVQRLQFFSQMNYWLFECIHPAGIQMHTQYSWQRRIISSTITMADGTVLHYIIVAQGIDKELYIGLRRWHK